MFNNIKNIQPEATPMRVYELCRLVYYKSPTEEDIRNMMMLPGEEGNTARGYYKYFRDAAISLGLIVKEGKELKYISDFVNISSVDNFRIYCLKYVLSHRDSRFYILLKTILDTDAEILTNYPRFTDVSTVNFINGKLEGRIKIDESNLLAMRFWMPFLGFGFTREKAPIWFMPNMAEAMESLISVATFEYNKEIPVLKFFNTLGLENIVVKNTYDFNFAASNGLKSLIDTETISVVHHRDMKDIYFLCEKNRSENYFMTHIILKGEHNEH